MTDLRAYLDAIDPRLWYVAIAFAVGFVVWLWKLLHRQSFDALPPRFKALPALLLGAALSASSSQDFWHILLEAMAGGLGGVTAVGGQEFWDRLLSGSKADRAVKKSASTPPKEPEQ